MKAYSINPLTQELKEIDVEIQANTAYTFFSSILIDESDILSRHIVYSDANALSESKTPFFLGGQLIVGEALIFGREDFQDLEVTIAQNDLNLLINYEVNKFYLDALDALSSTELNLYRMVEVDSGSEKVPLNAEWVLSTFNIADDRTKEYFINELKKTIDAGESVEEYMKKMAGLALDAAS